MAKLPLYKQAEMLRQEYEKRGIKYVYNQRNRNVYLSILNAPYVAEEEEGCQLTGHLIVYGGVIASSDIEKWINEVKRSYIKCWEHNPAMLKYANTIQ